MHSVRSETQSGEPLIIARSDKMLRVLDLATRAAASDATVLIQGDTGTGKELIARTIHHKSPRSTGPFVAVNCGAYTDSLLASELFGHRRGAFTGAVADRAGVFEAASGGTVFLDEIGAMSPAMQVKILRVLQERVVTRVGDSNERSVDARVLAATNADLANLVKAGTFREDLYYRVKVVQCRIPPLRERREDIGPLLDHYLDHFASRSGKRDIQLGVDTRHRLMEYDWPGNIRQLVGEIEQIVAMADSASIVQPQQLSEELLAGPGEPGPVTDAPPATTTSPDATYQELLDEWTRDVIARRLERFEGNITRTAQSLAISRSTLYALLKKYGMHGRDE